MKRGTRGGHRPPAADTGDATREATALHQAGRLAEAEARYRAILKLRPHDAEVTHLLGVVALQTGRPAEAVELISAAVGLNGTVSRYHDNLGSALSAAGRFDEAASAHLRALKLNVLSEKAWLNMGNALAAGKRGAAARAFLNALVVRPDYAKAWHNLGNALRGRNDAAAVVSYGRAETVDPAMIEAMINRGLSLADLDRLDEATTVARRVVKARPDEARCWYNLGVVLQRRGANEEAELVYREAVRRDPRNAAVLNNLGCVLRRLGRPADAERLHRAALDLAPDFVEALYNLGNAIRLQGRIDEAVALYAEAARRRPDLAGPVFNLGRVMLARGDLKRGWEAEERRFAAGEAKPNRRPPAPRWNGGKLEGRLLIWREQGVGDEILYASLYAETAARLKRPPIVEADRRLVSLFQRSFPMVEVRAETLDANGRETAITPDIAAHIPAGSLPRLTRPALASFPPSRRWLTPDPARVTDAGAWLDSLPRGLRVGVSWTSGLIDVERRVCYTALRDWAPVLGLPGVVAINLQYGDREEEIAAVEAEFGVTVFRPPGLDLKDDFEGTAALVSRLDLVVTVGTAVGELAGALRVPVWRVGFAEEWTALGTDCRPWFSSMRLMTPAPGEALSDAPRSVARALVRTARPPRPSVDALIEAAVEAHRSGRSDEAERGYRETLAAFPDNIDANHLLGVLLHQTGRSAEAEGPMRVALARDPLFAGAWNSLGITLDVRGREREAERAFTRAVVVDPALPEAWSHLGLTRRDPGRAVAARRRGVLLRPDDATFVTNLGSAVEGRGDFPTALALFRRAATLAPELGDALNNVGNATRLNGNEAEAETWFRRASQAAPEHALAAWNVGLLDLERGRLEEGWRGYARRFDALPRMGRRRFAVPEWNGEPMPSGSLLVWGEQGVGDEILFSAFASLPKSVVGRVVLECDRRLVPLFARSLPGVEVRRDDAGPRDFDRHVPIGSLPGLSDDARLVHPLGRTGWLVPDPAAVAGFRTWLDDLPSGIKIGVAWRSGLVDAYRAASYVRLLDLAPLSSVPGVSAVCLQYGDTATEIADLEMKTGLRLHRHPDLDLRDDFDGTAALIAGLDLVVSVSTAAGELAGAVGTPTWRLCGSDWTWLGTGVRPWMPAQRPFPRGINTVVQTLRALRTA